MAGDAARKTSVLILECAQEASCGVVFEPYGAEHILRREDRFRVEISGPGSGEVSVWHGPGVISVTPWEGGDFVSVTNRIGDELPT